MEYAGRYFDCHGCMSDESGGKQLDYFVTSLPCYRGDSVQDVT